ncbi:MAG: D-aminoacylase [Bacteroidota bacterium]
MRNSISRRRFLKQSALFGVSSTFLGGLTFTSIRSVRPAFDLIIRNGAVIDGSGTMENALDVGIKDGKIAKIGDLQAMDAIATIDATGLKVVPGFIDIHSHTDVDLFLNPRAESKIRQGVTTEVIGNDGSSWAPVGGPEIEEDLQRFKDYYGVELSWRDFRGLFDALERNGTAVNLLSFVGLGTLRELVVGLDDRRATPDEISSMQREVIAAAEQGCWGASTGLEYTPGSFADRDELVELVRVLPEEQRVYATHMRDEGDRLLEAIDEAIDVARRAKARLQISHLKAQGKSNWDKVDEALNRLDDAAGEGLDIHADRYPYVAYNTGLSSLFPIWCREGGRERFFGRLRDSTLRRKIRSEVEAKVQSLAGGWDGVLISFVLSDSNKVYQGKTVKQISEESDVDAFEFCRQILIAEDGRVNMVGFGMDEEGTEKVLAHPRVMVSSDAGSSATYGKLSQSRPHPRSYGTFPRAIARFVREKKLVTLPEMIRKMTLMPAEKIGLKDRGKIEVGRVADIVIFDYNAIEDRATFLDPHQYAVGIPHVMVNGVHVMKDGQHTGALPGRVLRSQT